MKERLQPSATLGRIMKDTGIGSVEEIVYADLRKAGWTQADAFYAAFWHLYSDLRPVDQKRIMTKLENSDAVRKRMGDTVKTDDMIPLGDLAKETSKEKILSDLLVARKRTRSGTKEWNDLTKMIADYAKIKQDDIKTTEQPIKYFVPVHYPNKCEDCLIYQNRRQNKQK